MVDPSGLSARVQGRKAVALERCSSYRREEVQVAVRNAILRLGGEVRDQLSGTRVLLKPNMLLGTPPERGVTTHPEVVRAVAEVLLEWGCRVTIGDSPGGGMPQTEWSLRRAYTRTGYAQVAEELGVGLSLDTSSVTVAFPEGQTFRQFRVILAAREADAIVGLPKLKTHLWTLMTGATKNLFGLVPGMEKPAFHARLRDAESFSGMLIDLNLLFKPAFHVMDAVIGMEGNGPTSGAPRKVGAVMAGTDPFALDAVAAGLIGLSPTEIAVVRRAMERGLLSPDLSDVEIAGVTPEALAVPDFRKPSSFTGGRTGIRGSISFRLVRIFGSAYVQKPAVIRNRCAGCERCARSCPVEGIEMQGGKARILHERCICCYCCHEMCPEGAITMRRGIAGALIERLLG